MGDDGDDGYTPDIKLKGASDVLDQVDKDTEEVLDFNFVPGSESGNKDSDSVDGVKGDHPNDTTDHANAINHQGGEWGENQKNCTYKSLLANLFLIVKIL